MFIEESGRDSKNFFIYFAKIRKITLRSSDQILDEINKKLVDFEFLLQPQNDLEINLVGAPKSRILIKILIMFSGLFVFLLGLLVPHSGKIADIIFQILLVCGGAALIFFPLYSFYSKKHFNIFISKRKQLLNINRWGNNKAHGIKFDDIQCLEMKVDASSDFVSSETESYQSHHYTFTLVYEDGKKQELFALTSRDKKLEKFAKVFAGYLSGFLGKELSLK